MTSCVTPQITGFPCFHTTGRIVMRHSQIRHVSTYAIDGDADDGADDGIMMAMIIIVLIKVMII